MLEAKDTVTSVLQKKTKKVFTNFFQAISKKRKQKRFSEIFRKVSAVFLHNFKNEQIPTVVETRGGVEDTRLEAKAKDSLSENKHSRGQGQECSRPRPRTKDTSASALQKKKKKKKVFRRSQKKKKRSSQKFFKRSPRKNVFQKIFQALHKILTIKKLVLSSSRGQANFRGLEASRPRPRTSKCVLEDSTSGRNRCKCTSRYIIIIIIIIAIYIPLEITPTSVNASD